MEYHEASAGDEAYFKSGFYSDKAQDLPFERGDEKIVEGDENQDPRHLGGIHYRSASTSHMDTPKLSTRGQDPAQATTSGRRNVFTVPDDDSDDDEDEADDVEDEVEEVENRELDVSPSGFPLTDNKLDESPSPQFEDLMPEEEKLEFEDGEAEYMVGGKFSDSYRLPEQLRLNAVKLHHMNALDMEEDQEMLFGEPTELVPDDYKQSNEEGIFGLTDTRPDFDNKLDIETSLPEEEIIIPEIESTKADVKTRIELTPEPTEDTYWPLPPRKPVAYKGLERTTENRDYVPDEDADIATVENPSVVDPEACPRKQVLPSRSFRVSWGPGGTLVLPGADGQLSIRRIHVNMSQEQRKLTTALLKVHRHHSKGEDKDREESDWFDGDGKMFEGDVKMFGRDLKERREKQISSSLGLCRGYAQRVKQSLLDLKQVDLGHPMRVQHSVWELIIRLWSLRTDPSERKKLSSLSTWLQETVEDEVAEEQKKSQNHEQMIRSLLTGRQRIFAAKVAQEGDNWRLSILVTQAGRNQQDLRQQVQDWHDLGLENISPDMLRIYQLLSGDVSREAGAEGVSWLRAFGLHLWYADKKWGKEGKWQKTVSSVVQSYLAHSEDKDNSAHKPCPPHRQSIASPREQDIRLSLLQLYTKANDYEGGLANLLVPEKAVDSYLDYTLSWHLHEILRRPGLDGLNPLLTLKRGEGGAISRSEGFQRVSVLISSYAASLEYLGLWKWSIYVLMDAGRDPIIGDYIRQELVVKDILFRHVPSVIASMSDSGSTQEEANFGDLESKSSLRNAQGVWDLERDFLTNDCGVPSNWIDDALALRARYDSGPGQSLIALTWLLRAESWNSAHKYLVEDLAPDYFSRGAEGELVQPLMELKRQHSRDAKSIPNWRSQGGVLYNYFQAREGKPGWDSKKTLEVAKDFMVRNSKPDGGKLSVTKSRFARSEVIATLLNVEETQKLLPSLLGIDDLMCSVNEHQRLQHLDRLSLRYLSNIKFT